MFWRKIPAVNLSGFTLEVVQNCRYVQLIQHTCMNETLYRWTFNFHKVVRQHNSGGMEDFILPYSAVYLRIHKWKNYWNRSTFAKVIVKIKVAQFFLTHSVHVFQTVLRSRCQLPRIYRAAITWWYHRRILTQWSVQLHIIRLDIGGSACTPSTNGLPLSTPWTIKTCHYFAIFWTITTMFLGGFLQFLCQWKEEWMLYRAVTKFTTLP